MRIGIVGAGGMGNVHARHYRRIEGVELEFFEPDSVRADEFAERLGARQAASFDELLTRCDAVDVCLPTHLHLEHGLRAIAAGRAVFMEKPLAGTLEDAARLAEAAEQAGVPMQVGHVVRYFPEFRRAHDLIASGAIGTPGAARTRRGGLAPRSPWFQDYRISGGVLLDLAIHDFDWLRWTLGEASLVCARSIGLSRGTWPDYALATISFECGAVAHVEATWMDPAGFRATFEVCGSKGMIEHDSRKVQVLKTTTAGNPTANESPLDADDDPFYSELKDFVGAVREGRPVSVPPSEGFRSLALALAAVESARTGRSIVPAKP